MRGNLSRGLALCLAGLLALSGPAEATPERITMSDDRVMAATQTHIYVLRDIFDNLGSHYAALHDQHLIEIELATGEATRFWPLRQMAINHLTENDFMMPGEVTEREGERVDMMAVLAEAGAEPLAPEISPDIDLTLGGNGELLLRGEPVATNFAIRAAGRAQLGILRQAYPEIESEEEYRAAKRIDFYDLYAEGDWLCDMHPEAYSLFRAEDRLRVAKISCEDDAFSGAWSFHVLIPDEL